MFTMRSFVISALLLFSYSWISVSGSETHTVEVQCGKEVTLLCSNISKIPTQTDWFRLANGTKPHCISSMYGVDTEASYCDGFQHGFNMTSNISAVFLKIKRVDLSDSGLYFCGFYIDTHTVISTSIHLNVQVLKEKEEPVGMKNPMTVILGALTVFLTIVIIVLALKIRRLQTAVTEEPQPKPNKNLSSDDLNYAALRFQPKPKRNCRPATARDLEPNIVYAATR
ncbi:hypothetical protein Q5P01_002239 [Channa striata]|uniref:Ig-like domain-containing protein n=1 Tax=Channa striata TaxID=64152 RepID=A0AA88NSE7_CHASR|nr:hypothetical protein Q5P01_002239 [Channa striata]